MACVIICVRMATGSGYNYGYCCGNTQATRAPDSQPAVNDFPISTKKPAEPSPYHAVLKLLVLGDSGIGKTCLILRYCDDDFQENFLSTIGIDLKSKILDLEDKKIKLQIWDTAGQERFRTITTSYYRGAQGIVICYDVTDRASFENVRFWMDNIDKYSIRRVSKVLVGCKCDMSESKVVLTDEGEALAERYGVKFFEVSAKNSKGVSEAFLQLTRDIMVQLGRVSPEGEDVTPSSGGSSRRG